MTSTVHAPASTMTQILHLARAELRTMRGSLLAWFVPTAGLLAATLAVQPQMSKEGSLFEAKLALMPKEMLQALGMQTTNLAEPVSYLATNFITPMLLGSMFAGLVGASMVSREEAAKTSELLLVQPVSRTTVVVGKLIAAVLAVIAFNAGIAGVAAAVYAKAGVGAYDGSRFVLIFVGAALAQLVLMTTALLISTIQKSPKNALPTGLGLVFGTYSAGAAAAVSPNLEVLGWLSPFRAVSPGVIARTGALPDAAWLLPVVIVVVVGVAIWRYNTKDLHA